MKKRWEQPKLIVLIKGRPEESLIIVCKGLSGVGDPNAQTSNCYWEISDLCGQCSWQLST